jgi:hypothetical protein
MQCIVLTCILRYTTNITEKKKKVGNSKKTMHGKKVCLRAQKVYTVTFYNYEDFFFSKGTTFFKANLS